MSNKIFGRFFLKVSVIVFISLFISSPLFAAEMIDPKVLEDADLFDLNALIMEVHLYSGYLIVAEKKIELVDFFKNGKRFKTMVMNSGEENISIKSLKEGQRVFVRGYRVGMRLFAREIYKLPGKGKLRSYGFFEELPEWEPVK